MLLPLLVACALDPTPPADLAETRFDALPAAGAWVRLRGQAHYEATITQRRPATLLADATTHHLFPFFPEHRTEERGVTVLVRTTRQPERSVSYETFTVVGRLRPVTDDDVGAAVQARMMTQTGHWLQDGALVLDAVRIESVDGLWEEAP